MVDIKRVITLVIVVVAFGFGMYKAWQQPSPAFGFRLPAIDPPVAQACA